jgi:class 3 adenylate cyclase
MAPLTSKARARLPDAAFAYIDSRGRRRLPINDAAHTRNALARFNQTVFEDEAARDRARSRLLKAAKKYSIVPLGFMEGQLKSARLGEPRFLPRGLVTLMFADIEDSTTLVRALGDRYPSFLSDLRELLRAAIRDSGGQEVDVRADELFAVFVQTSKALATALSIQRILSARTWPDNVECRLRIGLHRGEPTLTENGYVGLVVNTAARVCSAAYGRQILLTEAVRSAVADGEVADIGFRYLGSYRLRGLPAREALYQVEADGLQAEFPPLMATGRAHDSGVV